MATFVAALATKIVKPSSALTKIALLNLSYTGGNRAGLTFVPLLQTATEYDVADVPAGVTLIADKELSTHDSNYLAGAGLRLWMTVSLAQFRSMTFASSVVFKVWQYDTVASAATVLKDSSNKDVTFTLEDVVEVVSVKDNQASTLSLASGIYTALYYPNKDAKVAATNKIKMAEIVVSGGRVHADAPYEVYIYEDDADSATMAEGASFAIVSNASDNTSTLTLYYDVGATPVATRDLSIDKDIAITVTDRYRSLNVTVRIVPIANPTTTITYATQTTTFTDAGTAYSVYSLTDAEITNSFDLGTVAIDDPLVGKTYSLTSSDAAFTASGLVFKPAAPIAPSRSTRQSIDAAAMFSISENGRTFALSADTKELYIVKDISLNTASFALNDNYTSETTVDVTEANIGTPVFKFTLDANEGLGALTASITLSNIAAPAYDSNGYSVRDSTVTLTVADISGTISSTNTTFAFGAPALSRALNSPAANTSTYAKFRWMTITLTNGTKTYSSINLDTSFNVNKAVFTYTPKFSIPNALNAYDSTLATTATKMYINRSIASGATVFPKSQMLRGGYKTSVPPETFITSVIGTWNPGEQLILNFSVSDAAKIAVGDILHEFNQGRFVVIQKQSPTRIVIDRAFSLFGTHTLSLIRPDTSPVVFSINANSAGLSRDGSNVVFTGTTHTNANVGFNVIDDNGTLSQTYSVEWFETFAPTLPTSTVVLFQNEQNTNVTGSVYLDATSAGNTKVFKMNGGDNAPLVANASNATVVTVERRPKAGGTWETWTDAVVTFTLSTVDNAVSGYATITLTGATVRFDASVYQYRLKYDVASKVFDGNQLYSQTGLLVTSTGKTEANVQLYQTLIIEDISFSLVTDVATDTALHPLNFNPAGNTSTTYIDLSPRTTDSGLINIAKSGTYELPAYQVIAHNTSASGLIRIKSSGVQISSAEPEDRFAFVIVDTTGGDTYGIGSTLPSGITYDNVATKASVLTNAPMLYAGSVNLGTYVQVDGSFKIIACGNSTIADVGALNLYVADITALSTPTRPSTTTKHAIVYIHAVVESTNVTRSVVSKRFGVVNSDIVTSINITLLDDKSIQFPDCFRMTLNGAIGYSADGIAGEQLLTYRIMARSIGETATYTETLDADFNTVYNWTVSGAPSDWFQIASNATGAGVTEAELNTILGAADTRFQLEVTPALAAQPSARRNPGWPERWFNYTESISRVPYGQLISGNSYNVKRWLEYRVDVQNKAAFAPSLGAAGYGYVSSTVIRPADSATPGDFKRRAPFDVNFRTTDTITPTSVSNVYNAIYRTGVLDNGILLTNTTLGMFIGPIVGTHILVPANTNPQYLLAFDPRNL